MIRFILAIAGAAVLPVALFSQSDAAIPEDSLRMQKRMEYVKKEKKMIKKQLKTQENVEFANGDDGEIKKDLSVNNREKSQTPKAETPGKVKMYRAKSPVKKSIKKKPKRVKSRSSSKCNH